MKNHSTFSKFLGIVRFCTLLLFFLAGASMQSVYAGVNGTWVIAEPSACNQTITYAATADVQTTWNNAHVGFNAACRPTWGQDIFAPDGCTVTPGNATTPATGVCNGHTTVGYPPYTGNLTFTCLPGYAGYGSDGQTCVNTFPPSVSLTAPANNTIYVAPATVAFSATAADSNGTVTSVNLYINGSVNGQMTASGGSTFSRSVSSLPVGTYVVTAVATDNDGYSTTSTSSTIFVVASAPPPPGVGGTWVITAPSSCSRPAAYTPSADITVTWNSVFPGLNAGCRPVWGRDIFIPDGCTITPGNATTPATGVCNGHLDVGNTFTGDLTFTCPPGYVGYGNNGQNCHPPTALPTVALTMPVTGFAAPASIPLAATAADSDGTVTGVQFFNGATLIASATPASGNSSSGSWVSNAWTGVAAGVYSITAQATDNVGAVTTSNAVTVRVNTPISVSLTSPAPGASFTAPASITLTASAANAAHAVDEVRFYNGATLIGTGFLASGTATSGSYVTNAWTNVAAGTYTITAVATDVDGAATTSSPLTVTVGASSGGATGIYYIDADHLNTPRYIEDQSQQAVWRWDQQEPFGDSVPNQTPGSGGAFVFNLRFPGQYADQETNTSYNNARDYDQSDGRYVQSDPIGLDGGINSYLYTLADPIGLSDPTGEVAPIAAGAVVAISAVVGGIAGGAGAYLASNGNWKVTAAGAAVGAVGGAGGAWATMAWIGSASVAATTTAFGAFRAWTVASASNKVITGMTISAGVGAINSVAGQTTANLILNKPLTNINPCLVAGTAIGSALGTFTSAGILANAAGPQLLRQASTPLSAAIAASASIPSRVFVGPILARGAAAANLCGCQQ